MKAIIQSYNADGPSVVDVPPPALCEGGVLVRTAVSVVSSGTERLMVNLARKSLLAKARARPDLVRQVLDKARRDGLVETVETVRSRLDAPTPLGYSSAGTVLEVGRGVDDLRGGDRVACAGSGFANHAEVVFVPKHLVAKLPASVDFEAGALTTLGTVALQGLRLAKLEIGETIAVLGLGLVGQLAAQIASAAGCRVLGMDPDQDRCETAERLGAFAVADQADRFAEVCRQATRGLGVDKVVVAAASASNDPVVLAAKIARDRGSVVVVGAVETNLPRDLYYEKELAFRVSRSYGPGRYDPSYEELGIDYPIGFVRWTEQRNMQAFVGLLESRAVETAPLVTHRFPIESGAEAYALIAESPTTPSLGVLLTYPGADGAQFPGEAQLRKVTVNETAGDGRHSDRPGVGILGAGLFASKVLLPVLKDEAYRTEGVCTASGITAHHAAKKFGFRYATSDERLLLEDEAIDAVVIATRHHLHSRQVIAALGAGKHTYVEKPLALDERELSEIESAWSEAQNARKRPPILMVGYNRRFAPMARRLKAELAKLREPLMMHYRVNAGYLPEDHWVHDPDQGGGRVIGEVCHFADLLIYLAGMTPASVIAASLPNVERYRDDNLVATLTFPNGSIGTLTYVANGDRKLPKERLEVSGGATSAVLDNFRRLQIFTGGRDVDSRSWIRQDKGHRAALAAFRGAIVNGVMPIPMSEILAASRATFAILEAISSGETVSLPDSCR